MAKTKIAADNSQDLAKEGIYLVFFIIGMMCTFGLANSLFS